MPATVREQTRRWEARVDRFSMLSWKIVVLLIGCRFAIVWPAAPADFTPHTQLAAFLQVMGIGLILLGGLAILWRALRWHWTLPHLPRRFPETWRSWLRQDWALAMGIDCMLARFILLSAIVFALEAPWEAPQALGLLGTMLVRSWYQEQLLADG